MVSGFKNVIYIIVMALAMTSCLPDPVDVDDVPVLEPRIVVSSQLIPGQAVAVLLTKSIGALDASDNSDTEDLLNQIAIMDANVTVSGNGNLYQLQHIGLGVYGVAGIQLLEGTSYTLRVVSPSMGSVSATTVVKPQITFNEVSAELTFIGRDTLAEVSYKIEDPVGKNWYMINAQRVTQRNFQEQLLNPRVMTKLVDDVAFDGGTTQDTFKVLVGEFEPGDTLAVLLSNVNSDYYNFMKIRENTRFGLVDFLGEPVNYPSNVEGGLGFFNLYASDVRFFILE